MYNFEGHCRKKEIKGICAENVTLGILISHSSKSKKRYTDLVWYILGYLSRF